MKVGSFGEIVFLVNPGSRRPAPQGCASGFWHSSPTGVTTGDWTEPAPEAHINAATFDAFTPLQRLILERALAQELEATAGSAPAGQIIDRSESLWLGNGPEFLRRALMETDGRPVGGRQRRSDGHPVPPE